MRVGRLVASRGMCHDRRVIVADTWRKWHASDLAVAERFEGSVARCNAGRYSAATGTWTDPAILDRHQRNAVEALAVKPSREGRAPSIPPLRRMPEGRWVQADRCQERQVEDLVGEGSLWVGPHAIEPNNLVARGQLESGAFKLAA